jgi:MFS transporter, FSR family, fosmidomycin resistance protein
MSLLNALTDVLRPRPMVQPTGAAGAPVDTTSASVSTGALEGDSLSVAGTPETGAPRTEEAGEPSAQEKQLMLHLSNVSHAVNHFQNQMLTMLYPYIMAELGMSYTQVGVLSAIRSVLNSICQGACGFLTPFVSRCKLLGLGNFGIALGTLMSGLAGSYPMLVMARGVAAIGSSAQHPIGYSILSSYFPKNRGSVIALNTSVSNVGTLIATPLATGMLLFMGWRMIFFTVSLVSILMGLVYFFFRDYGAPSRVGSGRVRLAQGFASYRRVLKNRNMVLIALVFMVGGAGREGGVNETYFAPHLANDFGYAALRIGILITAMNIGGIIGPIFFGWLSDRLSRTRVLQMSLALSFVGSLWIASLGPGVAVLCISLLLYGAVTYSRGTQTQVIVADSVTDEDRDAAFSMYFFLGFLSQPFWVLVTGYLMDTVGFATALRVLSGTYLLGICILFFVKDERQTVRKASL